MDIFLQYLMRIIPCMGDQILQENSKYAELVRGFCKGSNFCKTGQGIIKERCIRLKAYNKNLEQIFLGEWLKILDSSLSNGGTAE